MNPIMAPFAVFFATARSTATTEHGLRLQLQRRPPDRGRVARKRGSMNGTIAPLRGPLKTAGLQVKNAWTPGSAPFGGSNGHDWLFCRREKYCHNGG
jgi:hypothetical protein